VVVNPAQVRAFAQRTGYLNPRSDSQVTRGNRRRCPVYRSPSSIEDCGRAAQKSPEG
jgi:hypothetical protein